MPPANHIFLNPGQMGLVLHTFQSNAVNHEMKSLDGSYTWPSIFDTFTFHWSLWKTVAG